jgi:sulfide:quinone oxidoreductase
MVALGGGGSMAVHGEVDGVSATAQRVLVVGAGVAGLETALALRALAPDLASVELLAPEREFVYRPLAVAEPFRVGEARRFPLERLVAAAGARLRQGRLSELDWKQKRVLLGDGSELEYGVLVLALGAQALEAIPGALTFRGHQDEQALAALLERTTAGELKQIAFALPAGSSWPLPLYELALLTAAYLADHLTRGVEVVLVTPEQRPLQAFDKPASDAIEQLLAIRGIRLETATAATRWRDGQLELDNGSQIAADAAVALPRLQGPPITGLPQDEHGFVATDEFGWVLGLTDVYAAGDLTQSSIKQGGIAAQQADALASAIQTRRHRGPTSGRARERHRLRPRRPHPPQRVPTRPARAPSHRRSASLPPRRIRPRPRASEHPAAVVATRKNRRPLPQPLPRRTTRTQNRLPRTTPRHRHPDPGRTRKHQTQEPADGHPLAPSSHLRVRTRRFTKPRTTPAPRLGVRACELLDLLPIVHHRVPRA